MFTLSIRFSLFPPTKGIRWIGRPVVAAGEVNDGKGE